MGRKNNKYTPEFKIEVAKAYLSGKCGGTRAVAKEFNVSKNRPHTWSRQFLIKGERSFYEEITSKGRPKKVPYATMTTEEKLKYKEMECDILKKFHALLKELGEL